ncbi:MAG: J domain-containing protein [Legionellaceae bacterium]|nr:J domain-containing protein [Legionellaceae bacterium]
MTEHHTILGVSEHASEKEIKAAYKKKALLAHPDKGGSADAFNQLTTAYQELLRLNEREDSGLWWNRYPIKFNHKTVHFTMLENPFSYSNYKYIEIAFAPEEILYYDLSYFDKPLEERMFTVYFMRDKLNHISSRLQGELRTFEVENGVLTRWYVPSDTIKQYSFFKDNMDKIHCILQLLERPPYAKRELYDYSLGLTELQDTTLIELVRHMGGIVILKKMIEFMPDIDFIGYLETLNKAQLLTPENIERTIACVNHSVTPWVSDFYEQKLDFSHTSFYKNTYFSALDDATKELLSAHLLTQDNFNLLIENFDHIESIKSALYSLNRTNLLNQDNFLKCIAIGKDCHFFMSNMTLLHESNFYNDDILKTLSTRDLIKASAYPLFRVKENYDESFKIAFQTDISDTTKPLEHAINQLFIHGLLIGYSETWNATYAEQATEKTKLCFCLAIELKKELYDFWQLSEAERAEAFYKFKESFINKLHIYDEELSKHRNTYSVFIENVLTAIYDLRKIFISENYDQINKLHFFKTASIKKVDQIEKALHETHEVEHKSPHKPFYPHSIYHM